MSITSFNKYITLSILPYDYEPTFCGSLSLINVNLSILLFLATLAVYPESLRIFSGNGNLL